MAAEHVIDVAKDSLDTKEYMDISWAPGLQKGDLLNMYDKWAPHYDQDFLIDGIEYSSPKMLAKVVDELFSNKSIAIMDIAAGTGLVGKELQKYGFCKIDALDGSERMLELAKKTGAYSNLYKDILGPKPTAVAENVYDAVITTGSFAPNHLNEECYEELIRITKPGGTIIILMNQMHLTQKPEYGKNIEPRMLELQTKGLWKRKERRIYPKYHVEHDGVCFILQKC